MARTRTQWETEINGALPALSTSMVAEWKLYRDLTITIALLFENILELFKSDVNTYLVQKQPGNLFWYIDICKEFQYGDSLTVDNGIVKYIPVDESHRIIAHASVREVDDEVLVIKVCREVSGVRQALTTPQLTDFKDYIKARKLPGTKTNVVSNPPDSLFYQLSGFYNPAYNYADVVQGITDALNAFRDNPNNFDAMLYYSAIVDALMHVPGLVNVSLVINLALSDGTTVTGFNYAKELPAGYFVYDPTSSIVSLIPAP